MDCVPINIGCCQDEIQAEAESQVLLPGPRASVRRAEATCTQIWRNHASVIQSLIFAECKSRCCFELKRLQILVWCVWHWRAPTPCSSDAKHPEYIQKATKPASDPREQLQLQCLRLFRALQSTPMRFCPSPRLAVHVSSTCNIFLLRHSPWQFCRVQAASSCLRCRCCEPSHMLPMQGVALPAFIPGWRASDSAPLSHRHSLSASTPLLPAGPIFCGPPS